MDEFGAITKLNGWQRAFLWALSQDGDLVTETGPLLEGIPDIASSEFQTTTRGMRVPNIPEWIEAHAKRLFAARTTGITTDLVTSLSPGVTASEAKQIADAALALSGDDQLGFKLGYTSDAMRRQMNIDRPNYGRLEQGMDFSKGISTPLIHPRVEPEVALRVSKDIDFIPRSQHEALMLIDSAMPALEIVDTRYHKYAFTFEDNVADNSSAAGFVLGTACPTTSIDHDGCEVSLTVGNREFLSGNSSAAMGGPIAAFIWLCAELVRTGEVLPAGSIVLTGGLTPAPYLQRGEQVTATFAGMGAVDICW